LTLGEKLSGVEQAPVCSSSCKIGTVRRVPSDLLERTCAITGDAHVCTAPLDHRNQLRIPTREGPTSARTHSILCPAVVLDPFRANLTRTIIPSDVFDRRHELPVSQKHLAVIRSKWKAIVGEGVDRYLGRLGLTFKLVEVLST
jgi:hypothetical protein